MKLEENMKIELSARINKLSESKTIRMSRLSRELKDSGKDIINLSLGEPDFITPKHINDAAIQAINDGYTHYPPVGGYNELKKIICEKFKKDNDLDYIPSQIVVSTGAKQSLINVMLVLLNEGDEVIVPSPYWVSYNQMIKLSDATMINISAGVASHFKISAGQLEEAITSKTKMFVMNSPSNPTGSIYSENELKELAAVLEKHPDIYILSDEIYEHINFVGKHSSLANFDFLKERTIVVNGLSKCFAMTGWRIGYIAAHEAIAKACEKIQGQFTSGACSISQRAAMTALSSDLTPTFEMRDVFKERIKLVFEGLKDIDKIKLTEPEGAFYLFPEVKEYFGTKNGKFEIENAEELCMYLLEHAGVSTVPGDAFGSPECIRLSCAASEKELTEAVKRIIEALNALS